MVGAYPERRGGEPAIRRRKSSVCKGKKETFVAGGISTQADLFGGWLGARREVS